MVRLGFLGLGHMGEPMATRLVEDGTDVVVWTRTAARTRPLVERGAVAASTPADVFAACEVVLLMLANGDAVDEVLGRTTDGFAVPVARRTIVNMGTVAPEWSLALEAQLAGAGARFVEAPVSGSRVPAQQGALVAMLAGDAAALDDVEPLLSPMTATRIRCGPVPRALETKLAVNVFLIAMVTGLAEAVAFAERRGVDLPTLRDVLDAGPMASSVSRVKLASLLDGDLTAQAAIRDVHYNNRMILAAAESAAASTPLLTVCGELLAEAESLGLGGADMIAVIAAIRARHGAGPPGRSTRVRGHDRL